MATREIQLTFQFIDILPHRSRHSTFTLLIQHQMTVTSDESESSSRERSDNVSISGRATLWGNSILLFLLRIRECDWIVVSRHTSMISNLLTHEISLSHNAEFDFGLLNLHSTIEVNPHCAGKFEMGKVKRPCDRDAKIEILYKYNFSKCQHKTFHWRSFWSFFLSTCFVDIKFPCQDETAETTHKLVI